MVTLARGKYYRPFGRHYANGSWNIYCSWCGKVTPDYWSFDQRKEKGRPRRNLYRLSLDRGPYDGGKCIFWHICAKCLRYEGVIW